MREVTVYKSESVFRARTEEVTTGTFRRRHGWRWVIERRWSRVSDRMSRPEDWRDFKLGPLVGSEDAARAGADAWLDKAEADNTSKDRYV